MIPTRVIVRCNLPVLHTETQRAVRFFGVSQAQLRSSWSAYVGDILRQAAGRGFRFEVQVRRHPMQMPPRFDFYKRGRWWWSRFDFDETPGGLRLGRLHASWSKVEAAWLGQVGSLAMLLGVARGARPK